MLQSNIAKAILYQVRGFRTKKDKAEFYVSEKTAAKLSFDKIQKLDKLLKLKEQAEVAYAKVKLEQEALAKQNKIDGAVNQELNKTLFLYNKAKTAYHKDDDAKLIFTGEQYIKILKPDNFYLASKELDKNLAFGNKSILFPAVLVKKGVVIVNVPFRHAYLWDNKELTSAYEYAVRHNMVYVDLFDATKEQHSERCKTIQAHCELAQYEFPITLFSKDIQQYYTDVTTLKPVISYKTISDSQAEELLDKFSFLDSDLLTALDTRLSEEKLTVQQVLTYFDEVSLKDYISVQA